MNSFTDRTEAGCLLGQLLASKAYPDPVVLALPRGGVPVGLEIARALNAPLGLVMVRKIGVPVQPELAVAAVVNGDHPEIVVNRPIAAQAGLDRAAIEELAEEQLTEIRRRRAIYRRSRAEVLVAGRTAIVVDDGIATGASMRAALKAVRRKKPERLVLAVPVAPLDTLSTLRSETDEIICLDIPPNFYAIGAHYRDFSQVEDAEVVRMLDEAERLAAPTENAPPGRS